ncbi:RNA polymerase sigma factor [Dyadobacter diqingensis]|uniref:RNA polymerase sigma factor n=1 Tax=Dyadobacter diqingensis TaxID=2938121 RepID=UPI0020C18D4D|nr:sigma-70 family RNA polymerase sigma factor [Dyadobacter diqingensis]
MQDHDGDLFVGLSKEHPWAFEYLKSKTYSSHAADCKSYGIDEEFTEDLYIDALVYLISGIRSGKIEPGNEGYETASVISLFKKNLLWKRLDYSKKMGNKMEFRYETDEAMEVSDNYNQLNMILESEQTSKIAQAINLLTPKDCITMIRLRFYEELSWEEIAKLMDKPVGSIKNKYSKICFPALRKLFISGNLGREII